MSVLKEYFCLPSSWEFPELIQFCMRNAVSSTAVWRATLSSEYKLRHQFCNFTGWTKNTPTPKITISQKCANIFVLNFMPICVEHNCAKVCCFVLYSIEALQTDGNANFKNEFCNRTDCKLTLQRRHQKCDMHVIRRRHIQNVVQIHNISKYVRRRQIIIQYNQIQSATMSVRQTFIAV